ncbi:MAG: hypothetical protein WCG20_00610 [bacterium]
MAETKQEPYSTKVPKKLRALSKQNHHRKSIVSIFKSLVSFSYQRELAQYVVLVLEIIHNLITLIKRPGKKYLNTILEATQTALQLEDGDDDVSDNSVPHSPLGKQQYVAVVGGLSINSNQCIKLLQTQGRLTKQNIRICDDIERFKSGTYTEVLTSQNCVGIILGPIPHSHNENVEKVLLHKIVYARNNSSTHGKLSLTKASITRAIEELKQRKII